MKLYLKGSLGTLAGQVGTNSVYTASHHPSGYLVVTALTSGNSTAIPLYARILAGTNFVNTGLIITQPKLTQTPAHAITAATSSTINSNAVTLTFTCTGIMNWVNGSTVVISGVTPSTYDGTYTMTGVTANTAFTVSKPLTGTDGAAGLPAATAFGTAVMTITNAVTGLYKTNLTSTITSATDLTFSLPNLIPAGPQAISIFSTTNTVADLAYYNPFTGVQETIALPTGIPQRLGMLEYNTALYSATSISGNAIAKAVYWGVTQ